MFDFSNLLVHLVIPLEDYTLYPQIFDRLRIASHSTVTFFLFSIIFIGLWQNITGVKGKKIFSQISLGLFIFLPFIVRTTHDNYAYDTTFALLCQVSDFALFLWMIFSLGKKILALTQGLSASHSNLIFTSMSVGVAALTLLSLILIQTQIHTIIPLPFRFTHFLFCCWGFYSLHRQLCQRNFYSKPILPMTFTAMMTALMLLFPFLFYFHAPAPPDADITSMAEMIGYLFQGQNFSSIESGIPGEWFSIRYPAGFPALGWLTAHLLNFRTSETLLLFWFFSFVLMVGSLIELGKIHRLSAFLILLFCLNGNFTGWYGLCGGQVQEMLSYALGIALITLLTQGQCNGHGQAQVIGASVLSAAFVIHPIVAFPFLLVFVYSWMRGLSGMIHQKKLVSFKHLIVFAPLLITMVYLLLINRGESIEASQPQILLSELTGTIFINNILKYLPEDSLGLPIFYLSFLILFFIDRKKFKSLSLILIWFLGEILLDGLFGHTKWGARFHATFSTIGIWVLSVSLSCLILEKLPLFRWTSHIPIFSLIIIWFVFLKEGAIIRPSPIFSSHETIRMSRYMENNLSDNSLVYQWRMTMGKGWNRLNKLRGDSAKNTVLSRIDPHQINSGNLKPRDNFENCFLPISAATPTPPASTTSVPVTQVLPCLKKLGVTHLLLESIPQKQYPEHLGDLQKFLEVRYGNIFLFRT